MIIIKVKTCAAMSFTTFKPTTLMKLSCGYARLFANDARKKIGENNIDSMRKFESVLAM